MYPLHMTKNQSGVFVKSTQAFTYLPQHTAAFQINKMAAKGLITQWTHLVS